MLADEANPAFDTTMSMPPNSNTERSNERATDASSVTSQVTPRTASAPKSATSSCRATSNASASMSVNTTQAPSLMSRRAVAFPMPPAPPVT